MNCTAVGIGEAEVGAGVVVYASSAYVQCSLGIDPSARIGQIAGDDRVFNCQTGSTAADSAAYRRARSIGDTTGNDQALQMRVAAGDFQYPIQAIGIDPSVVGQGRRYRRRLDGDSVDNVEITGGGCVFILSRQAEDDIRAERHDDPVGATQGIGFHHCGAQGTARGGRRDCGNLADAVSGVGIHGIDTGEVDGKVGSQRMQGQQQPGQYGNNTFHRKHPVRRLSIHTEKRAQEGHGVACVPAWQAPGGLEPGRAWPAHETEPSQAR